MSERHYDVSGERFEKIRTATALNAPARHLYYVDAGYEVDALHGTHELHLFAGGRRVATRIRMTCALRVELVSEFKGGAAVLVSMDSEGLAAVRSTLIQAAASDPGKRSNLEHSGVTLAVEVRDGPTTLSLHGDLVVWRLSSNAVTEVIEKLDALESSAKPSHHYIDISQPVENLVLSKDEYS